VLIVFAWSVGLLVSGILLRYGLGAENLAWSLMFIIQPLGCIFYPVAALPGWLQPICWVLPPTYVFEGLRGVLIDHVLHTDLMLTGLAIDSLLFMEPPSPLRGCLPARDGREPCCKRGIGIVGEDHGTSPIATSGSATKRPTCASVSG